MSSDISLKLDVLKKQLDWESILKNTEEHPYTVSELLDYVFSYMEGSTQNCVINNDIETNILDTGVSVTDKMCHFLKLIKDVSDYTTKGHNEYILTVLKPLQEIYEDINSVVETFKGDTKFNMSHNKYESLKVVFNKLGRDAIPTLNNTNASLDDVKGNILKEYRLVSYGYEHFPKDKDYFTIEDIKDILFCLPVDADNKSLRIRLKHILKFVPGYDNSSGVICDDDISKFVKDVVTKKEIIIFNYGFVKIEEHSGKIVDGQLDYDVYLTSNGRKNRAIRLRNHNKDSIDRFNGKHIPLGFWHPLLYSSKICEMVPEK
ncbi:MAG: hypothetical protein K0B07_04625 [DPANN group archaeon]|nr:hypothetical protein [DPANN group archaeon]